MIEFGKPGYNFCNEVANTVLNNRFEMPLESIDVLIHQIGMEKGVCLTDEQVETIMDIVKFFW